MTSKPMPWWRTDDYTIEAALPEFMSNFAGPMGLALVRAYDDGRTTGGWGTEDGGSGTFMSNYLAKKFAQNKALHAFKAKDQPFAIVMRSVLLVCIDIDGKNGGLEHAKKLGALPPTLAETSKSGDGYHLFYEVDDEWDDTLGYAVLGDRIGIETGVDFRGVGCVYHYPQQRWNDRKPAPLPDYLKDLLMTKQQERTQRKAFAAKVVASGDEEEILMLQATLEADLKKPIPEGKRNNTLFAIGQQMRDAQVDDWETKIEDRATQLGLDTGEIDKLVTNIGRF
jgi:hypothetical protein